MIWVFVFFLACSGDGNPECERTEVRFETEALCQVYLKTMVTAELRNTVVMDPRGLASGSGCVPIKLDVSS